MGQSREDNVKKCKSTDSESIITGCTALILSGQETTKGLSVVYDIRGVAYYEKGDYDRAIHDLGEAIRLNSSNENAYYSRGLAYKKKGDYDRAIQDFTEAIHLDPKFERAYYDRGNCYINKVDYDRAIAEFDEAIQLNPKNAINYNNRGVAYSRKGDTGRAIQDYNQAIQLHPNDATVYLNRGSAYFGQSNMTAAIADFEHAISAAPSSSAAVSAALMLHVVMKRHDDARQLAQVAATADLSKWPGPLLKLDLGQMTADEAITAAASPRSDLQKLQVCEANYFIGEDALLRHQRTTALAHLKATRDGCPRWNMYYAASLAELKRLGVSAAPAK
jgi:tetratricopeptide (TPR) repeat protein